MHNLVGFRIDLVCDMSTGSIFTTSKLIEKAFSGIQLFKLSIIFNISFVSLIRHGKFLQGYILLFYRYKQRFNCCTATTMSPSIHNESRIKGAEGLLNTRSILNPPTSCILKALHLCLECSNSIFNKFYLQINGKTQGHCMACSYSDIAMGVYDEKATHQLFKHLIWKRFRDHVIALWIDSNEDANNCLQYLNTIDASGKIKFIMQAENENDFQFLDLRLKRL